MFAPCAALPLLVSLLGAECEGGACCPLPNPTDYAKVVAADKGLIHYWRFEDDLKDTACKADAESRGGEAEFTAGPAAGKSLKLDGGRFAALGDGAAIEEKNATVELWFMPDFKPGLKYNPCLIAKRAAGDHARTLASVHVWGDYSCVGIWNGRQVVKYAVPAGVLERGAWHHLAVVCRDKDPRMELYLDGVPCVPDVVGATFAYQEKGLPLSLGSSTPKGQEHFDGRIDEVAIYNRALSAEEIAAHVDAMGWKTKRIGLVSAIKEAAERERRTQVENDSLRETKKAQMLADPRLTTRGEPTVYRGDHLAAINLPLGGIGTGCIQINGRGELAIWQIFGNFREQKVPNSFFAIRAKAENKPAVVRVLQTTPVGPFAAMKELTFRGAYPFGWYDFIDDELPVKVQLEAFNPLVPLDTKASSIPCAIFNITVENTTDKAVDVNLLASQQNAVGYRGDKPIEGRRYAGYGGNVNRLVRRDDSTWLHMTTQQPKNSPAYGDLVLVALSKKAIGVESYGNVEPLPAFESDAEAAPPTESQTAPSAVDETYDGALGVPLRLAAGEKKTVSFFLVWHFPNQDQGAGAWGGKGVMYNNWWKDATAVAEYLEQNLPELTRRTRLYQESLYSSNLPYWLLDRISSQVAVLRSATCYWTKDGYFGGWEGCSPAKGCCPGNCNHVWHYAQAHARLFPDLARTLREQEFRFQEANGSIPHRQPKSHAAFDGQCGAVLNSYREHLISRDQAWLDQHWPNIKRAMEFLIITWDKDEDGVLAGPQWNTLDGNLGGSTSWLGSLYLAALRASEEMARLEKDATAAERYRRIFAAGAKKQDETLFNGEYYIQLPDAQSHEDYGTGCHIDQVLGQWWANQLDLGPIYPIEHVNTALRSMAKYNFRADFQGIKQLPRKFVADFDPGTQMICWPAGKRPPKVMRYADEAMTGFEYSAAAAMMQQGLLKEGLLAAHAVNVRYDGRLRTKLTPGDFSSWGYSGNPFGDDECGKFYARAMSSWSLLLACQGFHYDGPRGIIGFRPVWQPGDHVSFFTAAEGWGVFRQKHSPDKYEVDIAVREGKLPVTEVVLANEPRVATDIASSVTIGDRDCAHRIVAGQSLRIALASPATIDHGASLRIIVHSR